MSFNRFEGSENIADVIGVEPDATPEQVRDKLNQLVRWLGDRDPVAPGSIFLKFSTFKALVALGLVTEDQILGNDDETTEEEAEETPHVMIYAREMTPSTTGGCSALTTTSLGAGKPDITYLAFDASTEESAQFEVIMPPGWAGAGFQFRVYWSHAAGASAYAVSWEFQAHSASNDETMSVAFVTGVTANDIGGTADDLYITSESAPVLIETANARAGDLVLCKIIRKAASGGDTLDVDARLHAIEFNLGDAPDSFPPIADVDFTWNPSDKHADITLSNGDLTASHSVAAFRTVRGTVSKSTGKWYFEVTIDTLVNFGVVGLANSSASLTNYVGGDAHGWSTGSSGPNQTYSNGGSTSVSVYAIASGDRVDVAWDADAGYIWFRCDGVWVGAQGVDTGFGTSIGDPASGSNARYTGVTGTLFPACSPGNGGQITINSTLVGTPPTGFEPWHS